MNNNEGDDDENNFSNQTARTPIAVKESDPLS